MKPWVPDGRKGGRMFERFSDRARRAVVLAQEEARLLNHNYIGTEHVLLGLLREDEGVAAHALSSLGISREAVRTQVKKIIGLGGSSPSGHIPFTPRSKKVLELSLREALALGHDYIGTEHILLGLLREGEGVACQVLVALGADLSKVRTRVIEILAGPPSADTAKLAAITRTELIERSTTEVIAEAANRDHPAVGTEHVLLWLLGLPDSGAHRALVEEGVDIGSLRVRLERMLDESGGSVDSTDS